MKILALLIENSKLLLILWLITSALILLLWKMAGVFYDAGDWLEGRLFRRKREQPTW